MWTGFFVHTIATKAEAKTTVARFRDVVVLPMVQSASSSEVVRAFAPPHFQSACGTLQRWIVGGLQPPPQPPWPAPSLPTLVVKSKEIPISAL